MFDAGLLSERKKEVLRAVISDYIFSAEPISSSAVTERHIKDLSPATIRNVMAELEEMGFLCQPHTSAGRIPTDKAFRVYVDCLMQPKNLPKQEREELRRVCSNSGYEGFDFLKEISRLLSSLTHNPGLAIVPRFADAMIRHIEFVKLRGNRILVVMVSHTGTVQNSLIDLDEDSKQGELDRMSGYLNELFSGLTIREIKKRLLEEMRNEKNLYDKLLNKALKLGEKALGGSGLSAREVYIEGQSRLFEHPEFLDIERMKEIFRAFEEKNKIIKLLDRSLNSEGVNIVIGCESGLSELKGCSLITATYESGGDILGSIGVIGPTRMDYSHIVPLVQYTAGLVDKMLKED